jgi:tetratricopeptide (TPR) repeat protein
MRACPIALALLAGLAAPATLQAEQAASAEVVEPSPAQVELYRAAGEAFTAGRYDEAIAALEQMVALSSVNIGHLSLGLALARRGDCDRARVEYDRALAAPAVSAPSPEEVRRRVERYRQDLAWTCPEAPAAEPRTEPVRPETEPSAEGVGPSELDGEHSRAGARQGALPSLGPAPGSGGPDLPEQPPRRVLARWPGWLMLATGLTAVAAGATLAGLAWNEHAQAWDLCEQAGGALICESGAEPFIERERTLALAADIALFVGAGLAVAGVLWLVLAPRDRQRSTEPAAVLWPSGALFRF